jgi:HicB-like protein involved in pilus formation
LTESQDDAIVAHMELGGYVDSLRHQLLVAAEAGGEDARVLAERLVAPLDSATRLMLLEAMVAAADEITRDLAPGSVEVRLRGQNPSFVVTPPPTEEVFHEAMDARTPAPAIRPEGDEGGTSRINLRLPDSLKVRAEEAAEKEGLSVNAWLVRAVAAALEPDDRDGHSRRSSTRGRQSYTGWVR